MAIDRILRQNFWIVPLAMTGVLAFFTARGVTAAVGMAVGAEAKDLTAPPLLQKSLPDGAGGGHQTNGDRILARNPFDSETGAIRRVADMPEEVVGGEIGGEEADVDPMNAPLCEGVKLLVVVASTDPDWSFASLQVGGEGKNFLRRRGDDLNGKTVEFVGWDRVFLSGGGKSLCQARLFAPEAPPAPVAEAAPAPPPAGAPGALDPNLAKGIQKLSATEYNIDRSVVDRILENQAELMKSARIVPDKEGDKVLGVRMYGIKSNSLLSTLGMENGDRLQTINGFDVSSPEKALEAYARLRAGADKLTVTLNRRGQAMNMDYNIK